MKNYLFIVIAILGIVFTSCKKEEEAPVPVESPKTKIISYDVSVTAPIGYYSNLYITYKTADGSMKDTVVEHNHHQHLHLFETFEIPYNFKGYLRVQTSVGCELHLSITKYYDDGKPNTFKSIDDDKSKDRFIDEEIYQPDLTKDIIN